MAHRVVSCLVAMVLLAGAVPALADWQFAIPPGWEDLSPGKPVPKGIPESISDLTQSGVYHTYAMDFAGRSGGFATNFNAIVGHGALVANDQALRQLVTSLPAQAGREIPGATVKVLEQSIVPVAGVPSLRIVVDVSTPGLTMRVLKYAVPGGQETAALTYTSTPKAFAKYLPVFEAAVQQTKGAAAAPMAAKIGAGLRRLGGDSVTSEDWQNIFGLGGRILGAAVGAGLVIYFTRRKKKASPAP